MLQGAPIVTIDLDIIHRRTPENVKRLVAPLTELDAVFRHAPRRLRSTLILARVFSSSGFARAPSARAFPARGDEQR